MCTGNVPPSNTQTTTTQSSSSTSSSSIRSTYDTTSSYNIKDGSVISDNSIEYIDTLSNYSSSFDDEVISQQQEIEKKIIEFGPIKVRPRKNPAPTLATGRRSKYEILSPDQEQKRQIRRARNRAAAEKVRVRRLGIEEQLTKEIKDLEQQKSYLVNNINELENKKLLLQTRFMTHEYLCMNNNKIDGTISLNENDFSLINNQLQSNDNNNNNNKVTNLYNTANDFQSMDTTDIFSNTSTLIQLSSSEIKNDLLFEFNDLDNILNNPQSSYVYAEDDEFNELLTMS
ncbi:unnamed protein product [Didymodactylos carnosus]|uniref:BZIP domain-containing protein n=1 Tax=Didymodactylos carnosus TaxID=1234261 RepID=A0A814XSF7_9BILA|nr:unnamed protein product [Didymodactylos carnosus]CAF3983389.1 unnamed protein product [Didymodactylos carnosus]